MKENKFFDWDVVCDVIEEENTPRAETMKAAFKQYVSGNSCFWDLPTPELETIFDAFRAGWAIAESFSDEE